MRLPSASSTLHSLPDASVKPRSSPAVTTWLFATAGMRAVSLSGFRDCRPPRRQPLVAGSARLPASAPAHYVAAMVPTPVVPIISDGAELRDELPGVVRRDRACPQINRAVLHVEEARVGVELIRTQNDARIGCCKLDHCLQPILGFALPCMFQEADVALQRGRDRNGPDSVLHPREDLILLVAHPTGAVPDQPGVSRL